MGGRGGVECDGGTSIGIPLARFIDSTSNGEVIDARDKGEFFATEDAEVSCDMLLYCSTGLPATAIPLAAWESTGECVDADP